MEEQEILNIETGTKEIITIEPKPVKIVKIEVQLVGEKKNKKAVFEVKHPDKEETIHISAVKYEKKGSLEFSGTWINLDEENKLRKGSATANLLAFFNVKSLKEFEGKENIPTIQDEKGYLCFKTY